MTDKKQKKKPVKMALNDFLLATPSTSSWADEVIDLPTAPASAFEESSGDRRPGYGDRGSFNRSYSERSDRFTDRNFTRQSRPSGPIPDEPPFTAYVGNLPYDLEETDINNFFANTKIKSVRIIRDMDGKPKGFGYVEFEDRDSISLAISQDGESIRNRSIRVNVAEPPRDKPSREDRTNVDTWRRSATVESPRNSTFSQRNDSGRGNRNFDRAPSGGRNYDRHQNDGRNFDRAPSGGRIYDRSQNDGRRFDRTSSGGRYERASSGGRGFGPRGNATEPNPDEPDRTEIASTWRRQEPIEPTTPVSPPASGKNDNRRTGWTFNRSESGGQPTGADSPGGRGTFSSNHGRGNFRDREDRSSATGGERKKLVLKPRTVGKETDSSAPPASGSLNSPFGNAKPRDENEMQRRVEERKRQREEEKKKEEAEKALVESTTEVSPTEVSPAEDDQPVKEDVLRK